MKFEKLRTSRFNQWVIIHLRYLIGFAFFPSGLVKLMETGSRESQRITPSAISLKPYTNPDFIGIFWDWPRLRQGFY
jgi:uncharacterized membrane protein YphA (DoxX/SURF4 family)